MKSLRLLSAASALILMVGCTQEGIDLMPSTDANQPEKKQITIEASFGDNKEETRTARKSDGKIYWNPADEINVFFGNDKGRFISTNEEDAAKASFSGSITITSVVGLNEGEENDNCLWGLYPYDENATFDGSHVYTSLSNQQTGVAGSFADDLYITLARSNSFALSFFNVLSGIKFSVQTEGITAIQFFGNNDESLTGDLSLRFSTATQRPVVDIAKNNKKMITLKPQGGGTFVVGQYYYILFVPTTFSKGFTMNFVTDSGMGIYKNKNNITFARNQFGTLENADENVNFLEPVDLGLSVKWGNMDLGALSDKENGDLYAWGETSPRVTNATNDYKYGTFPTGSYGTMTKYNETDGLTVLEACDDAATALLGPKWRMPTADEWRELLNNCTWSDNMINASTLSYTISGNGNYIRLTAAMSERNYYKYVWYWSSSVVTGAFDNTYATDFRFAYDYDEYEIQVPGTASVPRYNICAIRPVYVE